MPLESATYISDFVTSNPAASDGMNNADDHMRLIKSALKNTFPGLTGAFTREITGAGAGVGLLLAGGNPSFPSLSFTLESTLGFYQANPGVIGYTGTLRGNGSAPPGQISDFGGTTAPVGWLACDGQAVSRTTYAELFSYIGTTWGVGDNSTTFNVPSLMARFRRHRDGGTTYAGNVGLLQNPANMTHTHGVVGSSGAADTDHTHPVNITSGDDSPDHTHGFTGAAANGGTYALNAGAFSGHADLARTTAGANQRHKHVVAGNTTGMSAQHAHSINFTSAATGDANEARPYSATVLTCIKV